jgi:TetR/AcrR family transcriptional regulator, repressor for uid operon
LYSLDAPDPLSKGEDVPRLAADTKLERRRKLIDAARRCVAARGFQSLTVDDVCAEAGVSKGAFYIYFNQKQDLLLALLDDEAAAIEEVMQALNDARMSGVERLRRFARAMIERGVDPAGVQIRADLWAEMSSNPAVRQKWVTVTRERRAVLKSWIEGGVESGELASIPANALAAILLALGDGLLLHAGLDPTGFRWGNIVRALDAILEGIGHS